MQVVTMANGFKKEGDFKEMNIIEVIAEKLGIRYQLLYFFLLLW